MSWYENMVDLKTRAFGSFAFKDVFGEVPPLSEIRGRLEADYESAIRGLERMGKEELQEVLEEHLGIKRQLDVRAGSMALPRDKVEAFSDILARYVSAVRGRLEKTK